MQRVVIVGCSGSGKSTLAAALSQRWQVPHIELDELYWLPGWQARPADAFRETVREGTRGERWVVAGNYIAVRDLIWPRATTIVWLDYGLAVALTSVTRRTVWRAWHQALVCNGNRESWQRTLFSRDSMLWWTLTTHAQRRHEFSALSGDARFGHLQWLRHRHPRYTQQWLATIPP